MDMLDQNPLILIPISAGVIFLVAGLLMHQFPPKKINALYGYRTNSSMKNQQRWDFAQKFSSIEMLKLSIGLICSGFLGFLINTNDMLGMFLGLSFIIFMVVILFFRVEKAIKNKFDN